MIHQEYTGPISELQGKMALTRRWHDPPTNLKGPHVLAQFDEHELTFNGRRMDVNWSPFPADHFTPEGSKPVF